MRIAIVVHGRFHAFDLARELIRAGNDVFVVTNYPKYVAEKFGIPRQYVRSNLIHGIVSRVLNLAGRIIDRTIMEPTMHRWFSTWAGQVLKSEQCDVIHGFSGICEELFLLATGRNMVHTLLRGSSHIREQDAILVAEEKRTGHRTYRPEKWTVERELREYELADVIIVLSQFAFDSFIREGVPKEKLRLLLLGTQRSLFRPDRSIIDQRSAHVRTRERLRVLTVGTFSYRKGAFDLVEVARQAQNFADFRFVGAVLPRARAAAERGRAFIEFVPKVSQFDLPKHYEWGDVFLFPTLEDGYAVVLAQAAAAGLPVLGTTNCAAPVLIQEGLNGWLFPIRRHDLFLERLRWCDQHREELATMIETTYNSYVPRDWSDVARDFVDICTEAREKADAKLNVARA
jgi:glycosyltransferase involved in cell wall biosynthesis